MADLVSVGAGLDDRQRAALELLVQAAAPIPGSSTTSVFVRQVDDVASTALSPVDATRIVTFVRPPSASTPSGVRLAASTSLDPLLRGVEFLAHASPGIGEEGEVLAGDGRASTWVRRRRGGRIEDVIVGNAPTPGSDGRLDQTRMNEGTLPLVALLHILREALGSEIAWPAPRAALVIDDPNLHATTYGHFAFRVVGERLREAGAHLAIATVPLDSWYVNRSLAAYVARNPALSLCIHGNRHLSREMARPVTVDEAHLFAAQALARVRPLERAGVVVERVVIPPHGACSETMLEGFAAAGYRGTCYLGPVSSSSSATAVGLFPADVHLSGNLPGIHRQKFDAPVAQLQVRAFLGQPIVLYGHHQDFADTDSLLTNLLRKIDTVASVQWCSLSTMLDSNYATLRQGRTLLVRAWSRSVVVHRPDVELVRVHWPDGSQTEEHVGARDEGATTIRLTQPSAEGPNRAEPFPLDRLLPRAIVRRILVEGRDRLSPVLAPLRR